MPSSTIADLPLALTMGEPAGVGPEITLKAWLARDSETLPPFMVIADPALLAAAAKVIGVQIPLVEVSSPKQALPLFTTALPVMPLASPGKVEFGRPSAATATAVIAAITRAVHLALAGEVAAVVTNPIQKSVLYGAGFKHPGHTEFIADLAAAKVGKAQTAIMMLAIPGLRVVPLTIHIPLAKVPGSLTTAMIVDVGARVARALRADFGISAPRLAVAGLNPHAGEDGSLGREEIDIIAPAVAVLKSQGVDARGPIPPDSLFSAAARMTYDVALCMYHDQALIPLKALDFERGVNVTLGLPLVRTSPDHGTALDIAGTGVASSLSLIAALHTAADIARHRLAKS